MLSSFGIQGFRFLRILVDGEETNKMDIENDKRKKKPKKIVRRKSYRKDKSVNVEDVASKVDGMKINKGNIGLGIPDIYVEQESKSQPGSRRNSTLPGTLLLNPSEVTRRASLVPTEVTSTRRSSNASMIPDESSYGRRESQDTQVLTRRGSVKRGSLSWEEEEALEAKKLKATLEAMGMMKKKQKEFTWDSVQQEKKYEDDPSISRRKSSDVNVQMSKETAMKVLGLTNKAGGKILRPRLVTDYTEFEILIAFQKECNKASMIFLVKCQDYR